jgi:hypothetical protein
VLIGNLNSTSSQKEKGMGTSNVIATVPYVSGSSQSLCITNFLITITRNLQESDFCFECLLSGRPM